MTKHAPRARHGVASESEAGAPDSEITVSPEMVAAGEAAFDEFFDSYPTFLLVAEIYRAMHALAASDRQAASESHQREPVPAHRK